MGKTTEDTAMELDGEGAANFEQLQDLIRKECDKHDRKYAQLEDKCNKLEQQVKNPQKTCQRGAALQITKNPAPRRRTHQIKGTLQNNKGVAQKALPPTTLAQKTDETTKAQDKQAKKTAIPSKKVQTNLHRRHKANQLGIHSTILARKPAKEATAKKLIAQFGVIGDPTISKRHNASTTLAKMPTWYYFSRPSNMAFHDFTKRHKPQKNLRSLLGLGLKFIPTPSLTNCWSRLKQSSYDRLFHSVHLRFHFAGKPPSEGTTTYDPKIYINSTWTQPHWTIPLIALEERLTRFSSALNKLFKT